MLAAEVNKSNSSNLLSQEIMRKVVFVGVSPESQGGIAAVLKSYRANISPFQMVASTCDGCKLVKLFTFFAALFKLLFYRLKGCKIAHIHSSSYRSFKRKTILMKYSYFLGYQNIFHLHGSEFMEFASSVGKEKIRKKLNKCQTVIALSDTWKKFLTDEIRLSNVYCINNVVPIPDLSDKKDSAELIKLTFLGIVGTRKGIFDILEVLAADKEFYRKHVRLTIGGNGEISRLMHFIKDHDLDDMVEYAGWISGKDKEHLLLSTDIYLLPSYNEGLPISILEAMSYGIPVISTPVGGIKDLICHGHNGMLVTPGDHDQLDRALKKLLTDSQLRKIISENSLKDIQDFFPDKVLSELQKIYVKILSGNNKNTCGA